MSVIVIEAPRLPVCVGLKTTVMVQLAPGLTEEPQLLVCV